MPSRLHNSALSGKKLYHAACMDEKKPPRRAAVKLSSLAVIDQIETPAPERLRFIDTPT